MSWVLVVSLTLLAVAVVLVEFRAIRQGDERRHAAPGFVLVTCGVFMLAIGIAAAIADDSGIALLASLAGLGAVALGAARHRELIAR
jgi:hypothetical protein